MFSFQNFYRAILKMLLLLVLILILYYFWSEEKINVRHSPYQNENINIQQNDAVTYEKCYFHNGRNPNDIGKAITYFEDLLTSVKQPEYDQGIFFIEAQCSDNITPNIKPRYACSIESAAKANPKRDVFVIFTSPIGLHRHEKDWSPTMKALIEYPNIHFRTVQLKQLCANTPLEDSGKLSQLFLSNVPDVHASDIIRGLLVYLYGGTYMDMDYMMLQPLDKIDRNWISTQYDNCLANALFDFRRSGIGHIVLNEYLSDLAENYNPHCWDCNGPHCFQRVLKRICKKDDLGKVDRHRCRGVTIHQPNMFFPLFGRESFEFFNPNRTEWVLNKTAGMMGFHFWNSSSHKFNITMRNGCAYDKIAKEHCPRIHAAHDIF